MGPSATPSTPLDSSFNISILKIYLPTLVSAAHHF